MTMPKYALAGLLVVAGLAPVRAQTPACTAADFAAAVDQSGASLRAFSKDAQPKLQDRMRRYASAIKLDGAEFEEAALNAIQDSKLAKLDEKSSELLMKVDSLGRVADGAPPDCAKLDDIKAASTELLAVMRDKSSYMLSQLDAKIAAEGGAPEAALAAKPAAPQAAPAPAAAKPPPKADVKKAEIAKKEIAKKETAPGRDPLPPVNAKSNDSYSPPPVADALPPIAIAQPAEGDGFTVDEIQAATRGFFGTVSTSLASVIEHAFKTSGRPSAYVLGTEGGGAFLAGLRFGQGTLFMRQQPGTREVFWHGPSLGTDFGASGSRTMFLIYGLKDPPGLYRSFTGVDGSAYFVGGVGITFLKGGEVLMAPIRSGLGLRVGANIGYVRFTDKQTWNPF